MINSKKGPTGWLGYVRRAGYIAAALLSIMSMALVMPAAAQSMIEGAALAKWLEATKGTYYVTDVGVLLKLRLENGQVIGRTGIDPDPTDSTPGQLIGEFPLSPEGPHRKLSFQTKTLRGQMPLASGGTAPVVIMFMPNQGILKGLITRPDGKERMFSWPPQNEDNVIPAEYRGKLFRQAGWAEVLLTKMEAIELKASNGIAMPFLAIELMVRNRGAQYQELDRYNFNLAFFGSDGARLSDMFPGHIKPRTREAHAHPYMLVALPNGGAVVRYISHRPLRGAKMVLMLKGKPTDISWDVPVNLTAGR